MTFTSKLFCMALATGMIGSAQAQGVPPIVQQFQRPAAVAPAPAASLAQFAGAQPGGVSSLNVVASSGAPAHLHPTAAVQQAIRAAKKAGLAGPQGTPPLIYHTGGRVMNSFVLVYPIFWVPSTLQNGAATGYSPKYSTVTFLLAAWLTQGHGLNAIASEYYQILNGVTSYVNNWGGLGDYYVDTSPYPTSGCSANYSVPGLVTAGNCLTDAQIRAEIQSVMTLKGWTGGINKIFMVFTSKGEGSCFDSGTTSCAYTQYCAYHSFMGAKASPTIYTNEPFAETSVCQVAGTPSPNGDANADAAASIASHEIEEAVTDPLLDAWFDSSGFENGDECNFDYGANLLKNPANNVAANQFMNGTYFELQQEWSNLTGPSGSCVQHGP